MSVFKPKQSAPPFTQSKLQSHISSASISSLGEATSQGNIEAFPMDLMRSMSSKEFVPTP